MTEAEWLASDDVAAMLEFVHENPDHENITCCRSDRKLRLFAVACCRLWPEPGPNEPALAEVEALIERGATLAEYLALHPLAGGTAERWANYQTRRIPEQTVGMANLFRDICGNPFAPVAVWDEGESLRHGNTICIPRRWLTPQVLALAEAAYQERPGRKCERCKGSTVVYSCRAMTGRGSDPCSDCGGAGRTPDGTLDPVRLAVLADALEEAGCDHLEETWACRRCGKTENVGVWESQYAAKEQRMNCGNCAIALPAKGNVFRKSIRATHPLLAHLRSPGPHVRGCAALDAILGRE
jgi:hypothetical protein